MRTIEIEKYETDTFGGVIIGETFFLQWAKLIEDENTSL